MQRHYMNIQKVYCKELDSVLDIYEVRNEYFKQTIPRKDFTFYCSDPECRKQKNPRVIGVVYNRHPDESESRVVPHFRKLDDHIETCEWVELTEALENSAEVSLDNQDEATTAQQHGLKKTDVIQIFNIQQKTSSEKQVETYSTDEYKDVRKLETQEERIQKYKNIFSNRKASTSFLHNVVSSYCELEERKSLETVDLEINKVIMKYRAWFKHIKYYDDRYKGRIFYGGATVSKFEKTGGYTIAFLDQNISSNLEYKDKMLYLYLSPETLNAYKHSANIIDLFDTSISEKRWIKCFFFGDIKPSKEKSLKVQLATLDHIHLMFTENKKNESENIKDE